MTKKTSLVKKSSNPSGYSSVLTDVAHLLEAARRTSARTTNAIMTATYWEIGRRIVEFEQKGIQRAEYGKSLLKRLAADLTSRYGRGFSERNLGQMRLFYSYRPISQTLSAKSDERRTAHTPAKIRQTLSAEFKEITSPESTVIIQTPSEQLSISDLAKQFPPEYGQF